MKAMYRMTRTLFGITTEVMQLYEKQCTPISFIPSGKCTCLMRLHTNMSLNTWCVSSRLSAKHSEACSMFTAFRFLSVSKEALLRPVTVLEKVIVPPSGLLSA